MSLYETDTPCTHRWDISARERLELLQTYVHYGLEHWGADEKGVAATRRFLLELQSFHCRYVPVGLLHQGASKLLWKVPQFKGRCELETLLASHEVHDWVELSVRAGLPPPHESYHFQATHKSSNISHG